MQVPESVRAYLYDPAIRRAVLELQRLDGGLLAGLSWGELDNFYRAELAARQFESEWALFSLAAWNAIWGGLLSDWSALTPDEQEGDGHESGVHLRSLMGTDDETLWFGRVFERTNATFYASLLALPHVGVKLYVQCALRKGFVDLSAIAGPRDENGNAASFAAASLDAEAADLEALRAAARDAVRISAAEIEVRTRRPSITAGEG